MDKNTVMELIEEIGQHVVGGDRDKAWEALWWAEFHADGDEELGHEIDVAREWIQERWGGL